MFPKKQTRLMKLILENKLIELIQLRDVLSLKTNLLQIFMAFHQFYLPT